MKFIIAREHLAKGLKAVARAVAVRGPIPILSHIKIEAADGVLTFTATDLEIGISAKVAAEVVEPGLVALPAKLLQEIASKLPNADVTVSTEGDDPAAVTLRCQRARFSLRGLAAAEFPTLPTPGASQLTLPVAALVAGIKQTLYATGAEEKGVIGGVRLAVVAGVLELVGTDGYRMAWREHSVPGAGDVAVVVPRRGMAELASQLAGVDAETVTITLGANQLAVTLGDRYMTTRLLDGDFPPFRQIIPTAFAREATLDRASLKAAAERVSIMAMDREALAIKLGFNPGELAVHAGASEVGNSDETLAIEYSGEPLELNFNADFLDQALAALVGDTLHIRLNTHLTPTLIASADDPAHTCLLMPVNKQ